MDRRPFEIVAECEMIGFPTSGDVDRISTLIAAARGGRPEIVKAAVTRPAVFRERHYLLESRFIVWAEDAAGAAKAVKALIKEAGIRCRAVLPSGRALAQAEVPPAPGPSGGAKAARPDTPIATRTAALRRAAASTQRSGRSAGKGKAQPRGGKTGRR